MASQLPLSKWVRLELEPVQVNVDVDHCVNFATVQSVVPGAHGLYYRENGERKALVFDTNTGKVCPPADGWNTQPVYIHLAHGTRHGVHFADYAKANDQFEKNIGAVQRLFVAAGLGGRGGHEHRSQRVGSSSRNRSQSKKGPKSGFEAQPENVHISEESDQTSAPKADQAQNELNKHVEKLTRKITELKQRNKELKEDNRSLSEKLKSVEDRAAQGPQIQTPPAEHVEKHTKNDAGGNEDLQNLSHKLESVQKEHEEKRAQDQKEKDEEINNLHHVIEELRTKLAQSEHEKKESASKLGEHEDLLKNTKDKVSYLEGKLLTTESSSAKSRSRPPSESHDDGTRVRSLETMLQVANTTIRTIEADKQKMQEANWNAQDKLSKTEQENAYLKGIVDQLKKRVDSSTAEPLIKEKENRIWELRDDKSKLEWRVGELTQWWNDSKWKIGELESAVASQRYLIDTANTKIQNLNENTRTSEETPFSIRHNEFGAWNLAANQSYGVQQLPQTVVSFGCAPTFSQYMPMFCPMPQQYNPVTRKTTLQIDCPDSNEVYLTGSFVNWKCTIRCEKQPNGKMGALVELPLGRHEFLFLVDGRKTASEDHPKAPNAFGSDNNYIAIN